MISVSADAAIVVGDISGRFGAFERLVATYPGRLVISVGDMIDRGPHSKAVLDWFMARPEHIAIMGNHEFWAASYPDGAGAWIANGGAATLRSFGGTLPRTHADWIMQLPRAVRLACGGDRYFISHAFYPSLHQGDPSYDEETQLEFLWYRVSARFMPQAASRYKLQIAGHEGRHFLHGNAICVDNSHDRKVGAVLLPECQYVEQSWLESDV